MHDMSRLDDYLSAVEKAAQASGAVQRLRVNIRGAVQGVGFRPFVYRLATSLGLKGWVSNGIQGVAIEAEGPLETLQIFLVRLEKEKPAHSFIQGLEPAYLDSQGYASFEIRPSRDEGPKTAIALPDIATCPECLSELLDPADRRYRYPFINCTHCGPRFSILEALPYDRVHTTMKRFQMCGRCREEYENPMDRRFHAQPNACPDCGPQLECWNARGDALAEKEAALKAAVLAIVQGQIVALKGIGGFQLLANARDRQAVQRLRERKRRDEKPFAILCPHLEEARRLCEVSPLEERLLLSSEAPIVLLMKKPAGDVCDLVAPRNPCLGVMLPYSPLHHLLMSDLGIPIVATSGNISDEPICISELDAVTRLDGVADFFLVHDRPIARYVDDSVVRVVMGRELVIRRARGYAPLPITLKEEAPPLLAVGAHLKNTVAVTAGKSVFVSQHIGDLQTAPAYDAFQRAIKDLETLYQLSPAAVACDRHPNYLSTRYAERSGLPVVPVQHHYAHALSCMAENELEPPVLGVSWDGTGCGLDKSIWGGEFLRIKEDGFERYAHWRTFPLPGGEKAIEEPARCALGLLYEMEGEAAFARAGIAPVQAFSSLERAILKTMLKQEVNAPRTSSVGRLFDAVASLLGLRQGVRYEAQAAMDLEFAAAGHETAETYPLWIGDPKGTPGEGLIVDWEPMIRAILKDIQQAAPAGLVARRFHNALAEAVVEVAKRSNEERIVLSGGCFQNRVLSERTVRRLVEEKFRPYWHQRIPPNDGGIALGQIMAVLRERKELLCVSASPVKS